jgi:hypothetical protein
LRRPLTSVSPPREGTLKIVRRSQVARFAGFLVLRALALTALRGVTGRITVGRPAGLAVASRGSGSGPIGPYVIELRLRAARPNRPKISGLAVLHRLRGRERRRHPTRPDNKDDRTAP